ncbi:MAG TPA: hypothetical protein V6C89_08615 [Drouetiella sp.]|jgi:hypothetical protein
MSKKLTQDNGTVWLSFGSGIFNCCKSIAFHADETSVEIGEQDSAFPPLMAWIKSRFKLTINCSPLKPSGRAVIVPTRLTLYSTETVPQVPSTQEEASKNMKQTMNLIKMRQEAHLMTIPLTDETLGVEGKELERIIDELKEIAKP